MIADPRNPNWEYDARRNPHKECQAEIARLQEDRAKDRAEMARLREENERLKALGYKHLDDTEKTAQIYFNQGWRNACGTCEKGAMEERAVYCENDPCGYCADACKNIADNCRALAARGPEGEER